MQTEQPVTADDASAPIGAVVRDAAMSPNLPLQPGDCYREGSHWVFTRQYHLRRGYCCGNGCRHCPYGNAPA
jgi:hypothetical protein